MGGLALGLALIWLAKKTAAGAATALQAVDPNSANNLAYQGANAVTQTLTGDPNQTFGGWLFDLFNPSAGLAPGETSPAPGVIQEPAPAAAPPSVPSLDGYTSLPQPSASATSNGATLTSGADTLGAGWGQSSVAGF